PAPSPLRGERARERGDRRSVTAHRPASPIAPTPVLNAAKGRLRRRATPGHPIRPFAALRTGVEAEGAAGHGVATERSAPLSPALSPQRGEGARVIATCAARPLPDLRPPPRPPCYG